MKNHLFIFFYFIVAVFRAQMPDTDIWLFKLKKEKEQVLPDKGENISNRAGYDNQPAFAPDSKKIFYVSVREDKQADIYAYSISSKKVARLTNTKESEYSPTPNENETKIHCVAVLQDSMQIIVPIDLIDGKVLGDPYLNWSKNSISVFDSVGYFTFLNADTVLYYKLGNPHSLRARCLSNGNDVRIADNPIRAFKKISRSEFIFGVKDSSTVRYFIYRTRLKKAEPYCTCNSTSEDFIWHPDWGLMKSEKSEILRYDESAKKWISFFDFSKYGISKITRFAFDRKNKYLLLVDNK